MVLAFTLDFLAVTFFVRQRGSILTYDSDIGKSPTLMTKKGPNVTKTDSRPSLSGALQHKEVANPLCLNSQGRPAWCSLMTPLWILGPFLGALP